MAERFIRVYQRLEISSIKPYLLIYGDLTGTCAHCDQIDIKLHLTHCPGCGSEFKFIAFRDIRAHLPKMLKLSQERPHIIFIDFEDYKRSVAALKAEEFLR